MDNNKIHLLRSYSHSMITSTSFDGNGFSSSGLEQLYPRTSTPYPDDRNVVDDEEWFASYGIFRRILRNPLKKAQVRGMKNVPAHFISGHLVMTQGNEHSYDATTICLDDSYEKPQRKWTVKVKLWKFRRTMKKFFKKCFKVFIRNKCDYSVCPVTCECQRIKSFLNKTTYFDCVDNALKT